MSEHASEAPTREEVDALRAEVEELRRAREETNARTQEQEVREAAESAGLTPEQAQEIIDAAYARTRDEIAQTVERVLSERFDMEEDLDHLETDEQGRHSEGSENQDGDGEESDDENQDGNGDESGDGTEASGERRSGIRIFGRNFDW